MISLSFRNQSFLQKNEETLKEYLKEYRSLTSRYQLQENITTSRRFLVLSSSFSFHSSNLIPSDAKWSIDIVVSIDAYRKQSHDKWNHSLLGKEIDSLMKITLSISGDSVSFLPSGGAYNFSQFHSLPCFSKKKCMEDEG